MAITIRWNIGDVSSRGFDALGLSIAGARRIFGRAARYVVCVNTIDLDSARLRMGPMAREVEWHDASGALPAWLLSYLGRSMAGGAAWKFAQMRVSPEDHLLAMDNDVILWRMPSAVEEWLAERDSLLVAEDVRACYGKFASFCPKEPRNAGIIGLPPRYDAEGKLRERLEQTGVRLSCETDEQGLQVAMLTASKHRVVAIDEVSVSGYYRPHSLEVGSCGAHFVGVNVHDLWYAHGFWDWKRNEVAQKVGAAELDGSGEPGRFAERSSGAEGNLFG